MLIKHNTTGAIIIGRICKDKKTFTGTIIHAPVLHPFFKIGQHFERDAKIVKNSIFYKIYK